jgi:hypothetical protein
MERWVYTGLRGSQGKIYRKVYDDVESPDFAEEYDNGNLCEVTPEGWETIYHHYAMKKAA